MKNKVIRKALADQLGFKIEDIAIEFLSFVDGFYEFDAIHFDDEGNKRSFNVKIKIEEY